MLISRLICIILLKSCVIIKKLNVDEKIVCCNKNHFWCWNWCIVNFLQTATSKHKDSQNIDHIQPGQNELFSIKINIAQNVRRLVTFYWHQKWSVFESFTVFIIFKTHFFHVSFVIFSRQVFHLQLYSANIFPRLYLLRPTILWCF